MAIFDIDEMINDPWVGLRNTDAYVNYVLEEVQRLYDGGDLKDVPGNLFVRYLMGEISDPKPPTNFLFDGREFVYLYCCNKFVVRCDEWDEAKVFIIRGGKMERWKSC